MYGTDLSFYDFFYMSCSTVYQGAWKIMAYIVSNSLNKKLLKKIAFSIYINFLPLMNGYFLCLKCHV